MAWIDQTSFGASSLYSFKIITALVHCTLFATTAEGCFRHRSLHSHTLHSLLETLNTTLPSSTSANHKAEKQSLATALGQKIHHISVNVETHVELSRLSWLLSKRTCQTPLLTQACHWRSPALLLHRPQPKPKTTWQASKGSGGGVGPSLASWCTTEIQSGSLAVNEATIATLPKSSYAKDLASMGQKLEVDFGALEPKARISKCQDSLLTSLCTPSIPPPIDISAPCPCLCPSFLCPCLCLHITGPHVPHLCGPSIQLETNS